MISGGAGQARNSGAFARPRPIGRFAASAFPELLRRAAAWAAEARPPARPPRVPGGTGRQGALAGRVLWNSESDPVVWKPVVGGVAPGPRRHRPAGCAGGRY